MVTMPGAPVETIDSYDPEAEAQAAKAKPYKPEMGLQVKPGENPYTQFTSDTDFAQRANPGRPDWKERWMQNAMNIWRNDGQGVDDLKDIEDAQRQRDLLINGRGGVYQQTAGDAAADAEILRSKRREEIFAYENMPWSETPLDWAAAVGGSVYGMVTSPSSMIPIGQFTKIGSAGWRMAYPVVSRMLDSSVSNAAMNAALNASIQAEEYGAGMRDEVDWLSLGIDAAAGAALGVPFGYVDGKAAQDFYAREAARAAPPAAPAVPPPAAPRETPPLDTLEAPTPDQMQGEYTAQDLAQAQEDLFGEVVGTRNLTPEQLAQLDDYLNAGRPGDIPQAEPETEGGLTNDAPPTARDAFKEADAPVSPVPEAAPAQAEPLPGVPAAGQPEGRQAPPPEAAPERVAPPPPLPIDRTERQFSPSELKVDAKRFQFKEGGDEAGVTDRLKGVKKWDPIKSGVTLVWEDLNGDFYIADGHQRHGLASRLEAEGQGPKIRAVVLREADGITAEDARAIAAAKNIAEGTGNAIDAAKILRSRPDMGVDLPPASALVRDAQGLASLSDDAFGMVINKKVPAGYAAQVGRLAPDPKTHAQLLELLAKEQPDNAIEAESMIRDALEAPAVQSTMEDMFGSAEVTQILFKERAQVLSAAATAIRKDRAAFATLVKEEARLTGAGNKLATQTNAERAAQDAEILATLQAQARRKGPVADALAAAAKRLKDGESRQAVVRDFLDQLRRSGEATGADGRGPGAPGRAGEEGIAASLRPQSGFTYAPRYRPPGYATVPPGFTSIGPATPEHPFGTVTYGKPLSFKDEDAFDLVPLDPGHPKNIKKAKDDFIDQFRTQFADNGETYLAEKTVRDRDGKTITQSILVSPSVREGVDWQLTMLSDGEATGHLDFTDFDDLAENVWRFSREGYKPSSEPNIAFSAPRPAPVQFRKSKDVAGTYYVLRVQGRDEPLRGRNGGDAQAVANHLVNSEDDFGPESRHGIGDTLYLYEVTAPPQEAGPYKQANTGRMDDSDKIGVAFDEEKPGRGIAYSFGRNAQYNERVVAAVPLKRARDLLKEWGYPNQRGEGSFDMAGGLKGAEAISQAIQEAMDNAGFAFARRPPVDQGPGLFDAIPTPATTERLKAFQEQRAERARGPAPQGIDGQVRKLQDRTVRFASGMSRINDFEAGADNKPQAVIPGAERVGDKRLAEMRAAAPLKAQRPQKQMDVGLFGSEKDQQGFAFREELVGTGLPDLVANNAPIEEIAAHPAVQDAVRRMDAIPRTDHRPGYMSEEWKATRVYNFEDGPVTGLESAVSRLTEDAKKFSTAGPVKNEMIATVVLGPPAAGKSTHAEKIATARFAAIVDPDEAKKVIPEFEGGIGANAVHEESADMALEVFSRLMDEGANLVIPKVGGNAGGIRKLIQSLQANGYKVNLVNMNVTYDNAFRRMIKRYLNTGRLINPAYVADVGIKPTETYRTLRQEGVADGYAEIDGNGPYGAVPQLLDDTGALDGVPGYGRGVDGKNAPDAGRAPSADRQAPQDIDPLTRPGGEWRTIDIMAVDETGKAIPVNAGDAVDFMVTRINSLRQLLECVNAG